MASQTMCVLGAAGGLGSACVRASRAAQVEEAAFELKVVALGTAQEGAGRVERLTGRVERLARRFGGFPVQSTLHLRGRFAAP